MSDNLLDKLIKAQHHNKTASLFLVQQFKPLLLKFARLLNGEDSYNDLVLFFLEMIMKINLEKFIILTMLT